MLFFLLQYYQVNHQMDTFLKINRRQLFLNSIHLLENYKAYLIKLKELQIIKYQKNHLIFYLEQVFLIIQNQLFL